MLGTFELGLTTGSPSYVTYENERISLNKDLYIERKQFTVQPIKRP